jgi:lactaldehyde dehydrogenase/glycolaldehyde dehydrogenase
LITGNTIVVKPSQLTPENAYVFAQIVEEVGLPAGVFNLVNGRGSVIGHELAANPKVGMVSLTGSVSAGQQTMAAAAPNITKVSLELGGKAPAIVMEDADIDLAVKSIIASRVINTGQVCNCAERVYVDKKVKDIFMEKLVAGMKQVKVGNPNEIADLDMGPLIEANALAAMEQKVEKAVRQGAKLLCGGHRIGTKGYFFEPTVLDCATQEMDIIREETFGPILPIVEYTDIDDAIAWANDCEYGLTSSVYTQNLDYAFKIMRSLKFGETYINRENFEAMQGFHAGWRKSGIGGADGKHGLEEYLQTHVVYIETKE